MGLAWRNDDMYDDTIEVSDEARRRVDAARVRDLAFKIKSSLNYSDEDADALARLLIEAQNQGLRATRPWAYARLIAMGKSPLVAERIAKILPEG